MAVATPDELRLLLGRKKPFSEDEETRAELLISLAEGVIEEEAGQPLESSTDTVVLDGPAREEREYHVGTGTRKLVLPRWPVTDVDTVTLVDEDQALTEGQDYTWSQAGILTRVGAWWPHGDRVIEVTYTAGFVKLPTALKRIALRLAVTGWENPSNLSSDTLGDHSRSWAAEQVGMELSDADRRAIGAYRARTTR